jgi:hypothetical protein
MRKIGFFDMILVAGANMFFTPIIVTLFPQILNLNIWLLVVLSSLCVIIPFCLLRLKNDKTVNQQVEKFSFFEIQFAKLVGIFFTLVLVKLFSQIMEVDLKWFILFCILFAMKPFYVFWIKKND